MKLTLRLLASNMVSFACVCGAIYLAVESKDGWGWFLFVAFLTSASFENGRTKE